MLNILNPCRLFIMGASGSGTTTLGRAIANEWAVPHADADDYFWQPTKSFCRGRGDMTTPILRAGIADGTNSGWHRCPAPCCGSTAPGRWTTLYLQLHHEASPISRQQFEGYDLPDGVLGQAWIVTLQPPP